MEKKVSQFNSYGYAEDRVKDTTCGTVAAIETCTWLSLW